MRQYIPILLFSLLAAGSAPAMAQSHPQPLDDAKIEQQARSVGKSLRCVVCQNQPIDESDAPLAADMRRLVRTRLKAGDSEADVIDFMRQRYGDFVLIKPPVQSNTYVLWFAPFVILGFAGIWYALFTRRRREGASVLPLSGDEEAAYQALIDQENSAENGTDAS